MAVTKADELLSSEELAYILYVATNLNVDHEFIKQEIVSDIKPNEILPNDEHERAKILYHLLFAVNADSNILPEEEKMIFHFAFKLGFHEEMTRDFVNLMKNYKIHELPKDSMVSIIKKYQN